MLVHTSIQ